MVNNKIVALVHVFDQVDLLEHFFAWHSLAGISAFLVQDMGSTDGTIEKLGELALRYPIDWYRLEERDLRKNRFGNTGDEMAVLARNKFDPKWLLMCDVDEFLVLDNERLPVALERAEATGLTSINIPCYNMTGSPMAVGADAVACLSLRIVQPYIETYDQQVSGVLPRPYIFIRHPQKSIVMASAFSGYVAGSHGANVIFGATGLIEGARFHHYSIRGYDKFYEKIRNASSFLTTNNHLESWWAWHWRRWIRINESGQLKAEYDSQFVPDREQQALIESGVCIFDDTLSAWARTTTHLADNVVTSVARPITASIEAVRTLSFGDWFICDNAFSPPERIASSSKPETAPFLFWLIEKLKPKSIVDLDVKRGAARISFCQALEQSGLDGRCISLRPWFGNERDEDADDTENQIQRDHQVSRHQHRLSFIDGPVAAGINQINQASVDLLHINYTNIQSIGQDVLKNLAELMSSNSVLLVGGANSIAARTRVYEMAATLLENVPLFEMYHGAGLAVFATGSDLPDAVRRIFSLSHDDARTFRNIYARLGAAVPASNLTEQDPVLAELRQRVDALTLQVGAFEGGCRERDGWIRERDEWVRDRDQTIDGLQARLDEQAARVDKQRARIEKLEGTRLLRALLHFTPWRIRRGQ